MRAVLLMAHFLFAGGGAGAGGGGGGEPSTFAEAYPNVAATGLTVQQSYLCSDDVPDTSDGAINADWDIAFNNGSNFLCTRVTDQSSFLGSTDAWRWEFPAGMMGGVGAGGTIRYSPGGVSRLAGGFQIRYDTDFEFNGVSTKLLYFIDNSSNQILTQANHNDEYWSTSDNGTTFTDAFVSPAIAPTVNESGNLCTDNTWHTIEFDCNVGADSFKLWIDNVLKYTADISGAINNVSSFRFDPTWGGGGGPIAATKHRYVRAIYLRHA